jgi:SAM-dependent methyltransferase
MFRWLSWYIAKRRLASSRWSYPKGAVTAYPLPHVHKVQDFSPNAEPYSKLAGFWDAYAEWFVPSYPRFLEAAQGHYGLTITSVLDLACGTGLLTRGLAKKFESVVGLDISKPMLDEAVRRSQGTNVRYVLGDFRDFSLGQRFDAVVCGSDSLNYVRCPDDLTSVCQCVQRHLSPNGIFVFDVIDENGFRNLRYSKMVVAVGDERFAVYYFYHPESKISEDRVVFANTIERHRRIAIGKTLVRQVADELGFEIADSFRSWYGRQFYVLRILRWNSGP